METAKQAAPQSAERAGRRESPAWNAVLKNRPDQQMSGQSDGQNTPGECERAAALSKTNRTRRRVRRVREDCCGEESDFPEKKLTLQLLEGGVAGEILPSPPACQKLFFDKRPTEPTDARVVCGGTHMRSLPRTEARPSDLSEQHEGALFPVALAFVNVLCRSPNRRGSALRSGAGESDEKTSPAMTDRRGNGVPGGIRTRDLLVRSQTLYPAELRAHARSLERAYIVYCEKRRLSIGFGKLVC